MVCEALIQARSEVPSPIVTTVISTIRLRFPVLGGNYCFCNKETLGVRRENPCLTATVTFGTLPSIGNYILT